MHRIPSQLGSRHVLSQGSRVTWKKHQVVCSCQSICGDRAYVNLVAMVCLFIQEQNTICLFIDLRNHPRQPTRLELPESLCSTLTLPPFAESPYLSTPFLLSICGHTYPTIPLGA